MAEPIVYSFLLCHGVVPGDIHGTATYVDAFCNEIAESFPHSMENVILVVEFTGDGGRFKARYLVRDGLVEGSAPIYRSGVFDLTVFGRRIHQRVAVRLNDVLIPRESVYVVEMWIDDQLAALRTFAVMTKETYGLGDAPIQFIDRPEI